MSKVLNSLTNNVETHSDSDEEVNTSRDAVVVVGEAPESEEDEDDGEYEEAPLDDSMGNDSPPTPTPEVSNHNMRGSRPTSMEHQQKLKYDTLLHKKLREKNEHLKQELLNMACLPYINATKEIGSITQHLVKSQKMVQGVSTSLRKISKELTLIENALESVRLNVDRRLLSHKMPQKE